MNAKAAIAPDSSLRRLEDVQNELVARFKVTKNVDERLRIAKQHYRNLARNIDLYEWKGQYPNLPDYEVFKNVKGYKGVYQIGSHGSFISMESFYFKRRSRSIKWMAVYKPLLLRTQGLHEFGYKKISLWRNEKAKHYNTHVIVARHFIPNECSYKYVLHLDNDPANSRWDNLKWGTQSENIRHSVESNRWHLGSRNNKTKLNEKDIPIIRKMIANGLSSRKIASKFGVSKTPILYIKNKKTWRHL